MANFKKFDTRVVTSLKAEQLEKLRLTQKKKKISRSAAIRLAIEKL